MSPHVSVILGIWRGLNSESSLPREVVLEAADMQSVEFLSLFFALDAEQARLRAEKENAKKAASLTAGA